MPGVQVPAPSQVSAPLQTLASAQLVPAVTGVCETPLAGSQTLAVQGFWSSRSRGVPGVQVPAPSQVSAPLQTLASAQLVPEAMGVWLTPLIGSHTSAVQGF